MTQKQSTSVLSTGKKLLRLGVVIGLAFALALTLLLFPVLAGTTLTVPGVGFGFSLPLGTELVQASNGLTITKTAPVTVTQGGLITYTIRLTNQTGSDFVYPPRLVVTDIVPAKTTCVWVGSFPFNFTGYDAGQCAANGVAHLELKNVAGTTFYNNTTAVFSFAVRTDSPLPDGYVITNSQYSVLSDLGNSDTGTSVPTIVYAPKFAISKVASPSPTVNYGDPVTYTITVTNIGRADATGIVVTDTVPTNTNLSDAGGGTASGGIITWNIAGPLAPNATQVITFAVTANGAGLSIGDKVVNSKYGVRATNVHTDDWAMGSPVTVTVDGTVVLTATKLDVPDPVELVKGGSLLTYTIAVTNGAIAGVSDVTLVDTLPAEVKLVSVSGLSVVTGTNLAGQTVLTFTPAVINAGATVQATVVVSVTAPQKNGTIITNTLAVASPSADTITINGVTTTSAPVTTLIYSQPAITLTKSVQPTEATFGSLLTYTVIITNNGADDRLVDVTDDLTDYLGSGFWPINTIGGAPAGDLDRWDIPVSAGKTVSFTFHALVGSFTQTALINADFNAAATFGDVGFGEAGVGTSVGNWFTSASNPAQITAPSVNRRLSSINQVDATNCSLLYLFTVMDYTPPADPNARQGEIQISNDGATWQTIETLRESTSGVGLSLIDVKQYATSNFRIGYLYSGSGSAVTGGWDIQGATLICVNPADKDTAVYDRSVYYNTAVAASYLFTTTDTTDVISDTAPVTVYASTITMTKSVNPGIVDLSSGNQVVTYTYEVFNTGNVPVYWTDLVDDKVNTSGASYPVTWIAPGDSDIVNIPVTITGSYITGALPVTLTNTATATVESVSGTTGPFGVLTATNTATTSLVITYTPNINISKSAEASNGFPVVKGDTITYTITITNPGVRAVTVSGLDDKDSLGNNLDLLALGYLTSTTIAAGEVRVVTRTLTLDQADITNAIADGYLITNVVFIVVDDSVIGVSATDVDTVTVPVDASIDVTLSKTVSPAGPVTIGDVVTYTFEVVNSGSAPLDNVDLDDTVLGYADTIPGGSLPLAPDDSYTFVRPVVIDEALFNLAAANGFTLTNTAVATGTNTTDPLFTGEEATDSSSVDLPITHTAAISVVKIATYSPSPVGIDQPITYTYRIINTGNLTFTDVVQAQDVFNISFIMLPGGDTIDLSAAVQAQLPLAPGGVITVTSSVAPTEDDIAAVPGGNLTNTVTIELQHNPSTVTALANASATVPVTSTVNLVFTKTAIVPGGTVQPGELITYTYTVYNPNTVLVRLSSGFLTDSDSASLTFTPALPGGTISVFAGSTRIFTATRRFTYTDWVNTPSLTYTNYATVTGATLAGTSATAHASASVTLDYLLNVDVLKVASYASSPVGVGQTITYTVYITNNGYVPFDVTSVYDTLKGGTLTPGATVLSPTKSTTAVFTRTVTLADVLAGSTLVNTAIVTATDKTIRVNQTDVDGDSEIVPIAYGRFVDLDKSVSSTYVTVGDTVVYTFTVTNNSGVGVTYSLTDTALSFYWPTSPGEVPLAAGATAVFTKSKLVGASDLPIFTNVATVTARVPSLPAVPRLTVTDSVIISSYFTPTLALKKTGNLSTANIGDSVTYSFSFSNTSTVWINNISITDPKLGFAPLVTVNLPPNSINVAFPQSANHTLQASDFTLVNGQWVYTNVAYATGTGVAGAFTKTVNATDVYTVVLNVNPAIQVTKVADRDPAGNGQVVNYSFIINNSGSVPFTDVTLYDPLVQPTPASVGAVAAGSTITVTLPYTVSIADANAGLLTNTVRITGTSALTGVTASNIATKTIVTRRVLTDVVITTAPTLPAQVAVSQLFTATIAPNIPQVQPVTYNWNFGDGSTAGPNSVITTTHTYTAPGTYTVTVVAANGVSTVTNILVVTVQNQPIVIGSFLNDSPAAILPGGSLLSEPVVLSVTLQSGTGTILYHYQPDCLGDPYTTINTLNPSRVTQYQSPGVYVACVTVDNGYTTATATTTVIVTSMTFDKDATPAPGSKVAPGNTIAYRLTITNANSTPSVTVGPITVTDYLPAGVTYNSVSGGTLIGGPDSNNVITFTVPAIAAGSSSTAYVNATVNASATNHSLLTNTATAYSPQVNRGTITNTLGGQNQGTYLYDFGTDAVAHEASFDAELSASKTVNNPTPNFSDTITYTIRVTNTGTMPLTVTVTDPGVGGTIASNVPMAVGASQTYVVSDVVDMGYLPTFRNVVTATGQLAAGGNVITTASVVVTPNVKLTFDVQKVANPTVATLGDKIQYSFKVTNLGPITLTTVSLYDALLGGNLGVQFVNVAPFSQTQLSAVGSYTVTESDLLRPNAQIVNTAIATASNPSSGLADQSNTAVATVTLAYTKSLAIQKIASRSTFNGVGQSITYTFIITNQGNVPLYNVHVVDPLTSYATTIPSLAAGASTNVGPASYSTLAGDLAAGVVVNTVTAAGSSIISGDLVTGTATVTVTALPNMSISKSALSPYPSGSDVMPGNQIVYQLTIANNGGPANNAQITDQLPADVTLVGVSGSGVVASGNSITVTTSLAGGTAVVETRLITVTVNDISSASTVITNQATLSATATLTQSNSVTHTVYGQPKLQITKSAVPVSGSSVETGQTIVYTLVVTNIGSGVAKQVAITDALPINVSAIDSSVTTVPGGKPVLGHLTGNDVTYDLLLTQTLAAGEHFTVMLTGTVKSGLAVGTVFSNTAYAEFDGGTPLNAVTSITNSNTVTHVVVINSNLAVSKTVNDFAPSFGDTITYTIRVTNTGTVPLTVTVTDPNLGGTIASNVVMAVGANRVYNITDTVGYRYVPLFLNVVTATGQVNGGSDVITSASVVVIPNTKLTFAVDKVANPTVATVGDVIQYSLRVRNLGPITLTTVSLYDALFGGNLGFQFTNVAPFGQSPWYGGNVYTVTESDLLRPNAQIVNTAIATASNPTSGLADQTATGTATVTLIYTKSLAIQKIASRSTVNGYNQPITYTFIITNQGNVPLYNVNVVDSLTSYSTTIPSLAAGAHTSVGPVMYNTQVSDLQSGLIVNTATAAGSTIISGDLVTGTSTVTVTVLPNMSISKSALAPYPSGSDVIPGNQIVYQLTIANNGGPANNTQITDQLPAELSLVGVSGSGVVASGNTITVTTSLAGGLAVYETRLITVTVNDISSATETTLITNQATLSATATLTQSNSVTHTIYWQPKLQITKSAVPVSGSTVETGQTIVYTLVVTNIGSGSAKNMVVTDTAPVTYLTVTGVQNTALTQPGNKGVSGHQTLGSNVTWFNLLPGVTLAPGEHFTVQLTATVNALPVRTVISNTADSSFVGGTSLVALSYITNSNTVTHVTAAPDLQLVKTANTATVEAGGKITYTIVVSNAGLGLASSVVITDNLDSRLNLVSASGSSGSVSTSGNAITLTTSSLAKSAYLTVTVVATVATNVTTGTQIVNTASVNCAEASADTGSVTITVTTAPTSTFIYLPIIMRGFTPGPNLVVNSITANERAVKVVIENIGNSPTSLQSGLSGFWVDFYVNPNPVPTGVNQTWNYPSGRSSEGVAWLITGQTLDPGETLTLTCNSNGSDSCTGTYVQSSIGGKVTTNFNGVSAGTTIYAQVDSASTEYPASGAVLETHELAGGTYDNITSGTSVAGTTTFAESLGVESASSSGKSPVRPR